MLETTTEFDAGLIWSKRERHVLRLRLGLEENRPLTLKEIGLRLGVSSGRARQIEGGALGKLARKKSNQKS